MITVSCGLSDDNAPCIIVEEKSSTVKTDVIHKCKNTLHQNQLYTQLCTEYLKKAKVIEIGTAFAIFYRDQKQWMSFFESLKLVQKVIGSLLLEHPIIKMFPFSEKKAGDLVLSIEDLKGTLNELKIFLDDTNGLP